MESLQVKCIACGIEFEINAAERNFFAVKQLILPKRCKPCRSARRALKGGMLHPMGGEYGAEKLKD